MFTFAPIILFDLIYTYYCLCFSSLKYFSLTSFISRPSAFFEWHCFESCSVHLCHVYISPLSVFISLRTCIRGLCVRVGLCVGVHVWGLGGGGWIVRPITAPDVQFALQPRLNGGTERERARENEDVGVMASKQNKYMGTTFGYSTRAVNHLYSIQNVCSSTKHFF